MLKLLPVLTLAILLGTPTAHAKIVKVKAKGFSYQVYVPANYTENREWPLITVFHQSTGRAGGMLKRWIKVADSYGIIVASPNSRHRMRWTRRDAQNTLEMIVDVAGKYKVDFSRIYASGFSAGANFAYRMMLGNPGMFRAIGPMSGRMAASVAELAHPLGRDNTRVCVFHGTSDRTIPYKNAVRATQRLRKNGFEVHSRNYRQGHWIPRDYPEKMWQCMDGSRVHHDS